MVDIENVHRKLFLLTGTDTPPLFQQECVTETASENIEEVDQNEIYEYPVEDVPDEENPPEENPVDNNHNTFDQEPLDKVPTQEKLPQTVLVPAKDPVYADDETDEDWLRDDIFVKLDHKKKKDRKEKRELKVAKKNADSQRNNLFGKHGDQKAKKPSPPKRSSDRDHCKCDDIRTDPKLKTKVCSLM